MRLSEFILGEMESILAEWEAFAATRTPAADHMDSLALRDHAEQILRAVAKDISTAQTAPEQKQKSLGLAPVVPDAPETAAQTHAVLRARSGFDINQLAAEYRALRASVLRLWDARCGGEPRNLDDVIRFSEAIDQALCESISFYAAQVDRSRNLLLGMLGHDMRNPLNAIQLTASYLARLNAGEEVSVASQRLMDSGSRMRVLLDDLVDFNRSRLGLGIRVTPAPVDLGESFARQLDQLRFEYPDHAIDLEVEGEVSGTWDERRLQQVLDNLVTNAVKYGDRGTPVKIRLTGTADTVHFEVANSGAMATPEEASNLFDPLVRGTGENVRQDANGLGLGLYIARQIALAHGGEITVHPHHAATVFAVSLPREREPEPRPLA
jgi:signal transduction histidine kinase